MSRFALLALSSCGFSLHTSSSFSSSGGNSNPSPAPPAEVAAAPSPTTVAEAPPVVKKGHSKHGGGDDRPGDPAPVFAKPPEVDAPGALAAADWNGTYDGDPLSCSDATQFDLKGPDVQTFHTDGWSYSPGFKCPMTCTNPSKATLARGKLSFPLVWVDDHPPEDEKTGKYTVTMRRFKVDVPLAKTEDATVKSGMLKYMTAPFKWSHNNIYEMRSDGVAISVGVAKVADVHTGSGRIAEIRMALHDPAPNDPAYEWLSDAEAGCSVTLSRDDWKRGDGLSDDDGGDETASSSPSHSSHGDGGARQKCKGSCRSSAGSCRTSCHGQSAKCASNCNHDESACERSCG